MADATRRSARFSMRSKQVGQLLLENGDVKAEDINQALRIQDEQGGLLGKILRDQKACDDIAVGQALVKQVQVTDIRCEEIPVDPAVAALIARETCETEKLCPFERLGNLLCVVMGNPLNRRAITQIEYHTQLKVKSFKSTWPKIQDLISRAYSEEAPAPGAEQEQLAVESVPALDAAAPKQVAVEEPAPVESVGVSDVPSLQLEEPAPAAEAESEVAARPRPTARRVEKPAEAVVEGIDSLDDNQAEVIETTARGLAKHAPKAVPPPSAPPARPKAAKKAKVDIDLDTLDLSKAEIVKTSEHEEGMEELHEALPINKPLARHAGKILPLKMMRDGYFYSDGRAPAKRTDELLALLDSLPVAEVVAQSIGEYEAQQLPAAQEPVAAKPQIGALELREAPVMPVAAVALVEDEFQQAVNKLVEDPVGEWDWQTIAPGPLAVVEYEEIERQKAY